MMQSISQFIFSKIAAYADDPLGLNGLLGGKNVSNGVIQTNPGSLNTIIANIITMVLIAVGLIALIMVIVAGFHYMTSSGEENKIEKSKKALTSAVIGLVVIAFSYFLTQAIMSILGLPSYFSFGSILSALGI